MDSTAITNLISVVDFFVFLGVFADFLVVIKIITSNTVFTYFEGLVPVTRRKRTNIRTVSAMFRISTLMWRWPAAFLFIRNANTPPFPILSRVGVATAL
mgnify:CR=1 FL=1